MCGIAGFFAQAPQHDPEAVVGTMLSALRTRGPDHTATFRPATEWPGLRLGYNRLSINDWSADGYQPFTNEVGSIWAVMNGEIYNWKELRRDLASRGHRLSSGSDVEVIPHLYEEEGDDFAGRLNGMFAIALVDLRRERLLLVRDRIGEKPLFYASQGAQFVFASTLPAVLRSGCVDPRVDRASLSEFLTFRCVPGEHTIVEPVRKVPPAGAVTLDLNSGRISSRLYWRPDLWRSDTGDAAEAAERLGDLVSDAVRIRIPDEPRVNFGATLSGGIDSSTMTALVRHHRPDRPLFAFSAYVTDDPEDTACLQDVRDTLGLTHRMVDCPTDDIANLAAVVAQVGEPLAAGMTVPCSRVFHLAHCHGHRAVVTGEGSDELFAGYSGRLILDGLLKRWDTLAPDEQAAALAADPRLCGKLDSPLRDPRLSPLERYALWDDDNTYDRGVVNRLLSRDIGLLPDPLERLRDLDADSVGAPHENRMLYLEMKIRLADFMLPISDRTSMRTRSRPGPHCSTQGSSTRRSGSRPV